ncbi:hypothetical protein FOA43_000043 [Brettanomyces nanus]|uniref:Partial AB-hydrolase lipase domain-containing protein n=1 Tax=Eeniella nana TaxID=13502 RepID=A0A875RXW8_EENNA|nr:uncharacterized protein FOA43_000043 [Brettanomyces nanus]QPG72742.1 hypothetical protein FOA43_000043 [Brettanomyces nanus]
MTPLLMTSEEEEIHIGTPLIKDEELTDLGEMTTSAKVKTSIIIFISNVLSLFFLSVLTQLALLYYFYRIHIKREHRYTASDKDAYPIKKPKISLDLRYYAQLLGCELYEYKLVTEDGFVIVLNRLVDRKILRADHNCKPILMIHGLLQSSGAFLSGGYKSLAYLLVQNGYDVWLGNNRCGFDPQHTRYSINDPRMWDWDLTEMCKYDLTCMIDQVLKITKYSGKISLLGHSQGTTEITMLLSSQLSLGYEEKIDKCVLLAPAVYGGHLVNRKLFIKFMRFLPNSLFDLFFGIHAFIPIMMFMRNHMYRSPMYGLSSYAMFSYLFTSDDYRWDRSLRDIHFLFAPSYQSSKLMKWWLKGKGFREGKAILDEDVPWFNASTPELLLVIGEQDRLVDGNLFYEHLKAKEVSMQGKFSRLSIPEYNHLDVMWADAVQETVGREMLHFLGTQ